MTELTPKQIALGIRAVKAGWKWALGDVVREWATHKGVAIADCLVDVVVGIRKDGSLDTAFVEDAAWQPGSKLIPDPTARGFVSAALAQVRERVGRRCNIYCGDDADGSDEWAVWLGTGGHHGWAPPGRTEAEAVVAALEATRWSP